MVFSEEKRRQNQAGARADPWADFDRSGQSGASHRSFKSRYELLLRVEITDTAYAKRQAVTGALHIGAARHRALLLLSTPIRSKP